MGGWVLEAPVRLIKAVYLLAEQRLFNSLSRKILGCLVPPFVMLSILSWQSLKFASYLRAGLGSSASPEALAEIGRAHV